MATMSDFVFVSDCSHTSLPMTKQATLLTTIPPSQPHPDGLATYRVYEDIKKKKSVAGHFTEDMRGEAIDIAGGPSHDVVMWRNFAELARSIDEEGWDNHTSPLSERVRDLAEITVHTKTILNALMKSLEDGFIEVPLVQ